MEKRYQVFISSTFQDLQNARQEVSQALLRADCFPAGMELFPAADEEQFEFIKTVIDQSDYYIIISAGRYGSIHPKTGLSYTEMEYDYAVESGKPVIRLLHKDPFNELKGEFIEKTDQGREKLARFRAKLSEKSLVKLWSNEKELGSAVDHSLRHAIKLRPAVGWVKSDEVSQSLELENYRLRERLANLESKEKTPSLEQALKIEAPVLANTFGKLEIGDIVDNIEAVFVALGAVFRRSTHVPDGNVSFHLSNLFDVEGAVLENIVNALILDGFLLQSGIQFRLSDEGRRTVSKVKALRFFSAD